jgi:hypothetical protein
MLTSLISRSAGSVCQMCMHEYEHRFGKKFAGVCSRGNNQSPPISLAVTGYMSDADSLMARMALVKDFVLEHPDPSPAKSQRDLFLLGTAIIPPEISVARALVRRCGISSVISSSLFLDHRFVLVIFISFFNAGRDKKSAKATEIPSDTARAPIGVPRAAGPTLRPGGRPGLAWHARNRPSLTREPNQKPRPGSAAPGAAARSLANRVADASPSGARDRLADSSGAVTCELEVAFASSETADRPAVVDAATRMGAAADLPGPSSRDKCERECTPTQSRGPLPSPPNPPRAGLHVLFF